MSGKYLRPQTGEPRDSSDAALAARGVSADLLREASRRLQLAGVLVGAAFAVSLLVNSTLHAAGWTSLPQRGLHGAICASVIALSGLIVWLGTSRRLEPARLLDVGLVYEVVVAFGIALQDNLAPHSWDRPLDAISWLCVWIVMFPLAVPATPLKTLAASLAAASTWPAAYVVGLALGTPAAPGHVAALNMLENYIAAGLALVPTLIIRRLAADLEKARRLGSYELVERLGAGGMGEVWRARHRMLARPAAVKLVRAQALGFEGGKVAEAVRRRFEREAQATAALHSPHTVELYDFGVTPGGTFYYVMEILDGLDLETLVRRFGAVPPERAAALLLQACDSLEDAHDVGLIHRDVKPANIYTCRKGLKYDFVKVLDFGLVKSVWAEDDSEESRLTRDDVLAGTPAYMAPEIALGNSPVDGRADLYALGCVGYWLLTGCHVFEAPTAMQMVVQHLESRPVRPSARAGVRIPADLEELILACLEKSPDKRPAGAGELAARLSACGLHACWTQELAKRWWVAHVAPPPASRARSSETTDWSSTLPA